MTFRYTWYKCSKDSGFRVVNAQKRCHKRTRHQLTYCFSLNIRIFPMAHDQGSSHKYAVVRFDNLDFSVVPISWLEEPNFCYWPEGIKNVRTAIIREMTVKENWIKYKCLIISKHETYESALKAEKEAAASSESECEIRLGKRKIRHNKFENYVDFPGPPKLVLSHNKPNKSNTADLSEESSQSCALAEHDEDIIHNIENLPIIIAHENNDDANIKINVLTDITNIITNIQEEILSLNIKQEKSLSEIKATVDIILAKVNDERCYRENTILEDNKIKDQLPLVSIEKFLEFENILKDDQEAFMQLVNKMLLIGGKHERDFVRRILTATFSDDLACMCSWTGQKNNFKIGDTYYARH